MKYSRWYDDNVSIITSSWSKKHYVRKIDNVTVNLDTMKRVTKIQLLSKETIQRNWHAYSKYMERTRYETSSEMETMGLQRTNIKLHSVDLAKNFDNVLEIRAAQLSTFHPWSGYDNIDTLFVSFLNALMDYGWTADERFALRRNSYSQSRSCDVRSSTDAVSVMIGSTVNFTICSTLCACSRPYHMSCKANVLVNLHFPNLRMDPSINPTDSFNMMRSLDRDTTSTSGIYILSPFYQSYEKDFSTSILWTLLN